MYGITSRTLLTVFVTNLLATAGEISQSWTSPMYPKLYSEDTLENPLGRPITKDEDSWIGSLLNIGAVLGAIPTGFVADRIGRKKTLIGIAIPHALAYLTFAFAKNVYLFYAARFINGIALGASYAIMPIYLAEITSDSNRATLSVTINVFWCLGDVLPLAIGPYLSVLIFNLILAAIPCVFLVLFPIFGVESPHYLVQNGFDDEAEVLMMSMRSCNQLTARKEIDVLKSTFKLHENGNAMDIFRNRGTRKAFIISLALMILQQWSGITAISYYMEPIFMASGTGLPASISSTICGACVFIFSFAAPIFIESAGNKWMLAISCLGNCLSLAALGSFFYIKDNTNWGTDNISWLPLVGLISYEFFYNFALAPLPWTISSELFPNNIKIISAPTMAVVCWLFSFIISKFFNLLNGTVGMAGTFWIYAGASLLCFLFDIIWVPETKGKSFIEIQAMLQK